jgi:hypothetical protein
MVNAGLKTDPSNFFKTLSGKENTRDYNLQYWILAPDLLGGRLSAGMTR